MPRRKIGPIVVAILVLFLVGAGPALAQYGYSQRGYGSGEGSGESGVILFVEGQLLNPRNTDNIVATRMFGTVTSIIPEWDDDAGGRFGIGYEWEQGGKLMFSLWSYETDNTAASSGSFAFSIGPPIFTGTDYIGDTGISFDVTTEISAQAAELTWGKRNDLGGPFSMEWSIGLRYANYEETANGTYNDGAFVFAAAKSLEGDMLGVKAGARGTYRLNRFSLNGGLGLSMLDGELTASSSLSPTPASFAASSTVFEDDSRSGFIRDLDVNVAWHASNERFRVWLGWGQSKWEDIVSDVLRNQPGTALTLRSRDSVTFSGFKLGAEVKF